MGRQKSFFSQQLNLVSRQTFRREGGEGGGKGRFLIFLLFFSPPPPPPPPSSSLLLPLLVGSSNYFLISKCEMSSEEELSLLLSFVSPSPTPSSRPRLSGEFNFGVGKGGACCCDSSMQASPTNNGSMLNESSVGIYRIHCIRTRFCAFGANLYAQSVLINKKLCIGA